MICFCLPQLHGEPGAAGDGRPTAVVNSTKAGPESPPNYERIGIKVAAGLALPAGTSIQEEQGFNFVLGPAFHVSLFRQINERLEISAGAELYFFPESVSRQTLAGDFVKESTISGRTTGLFVSARYNLVKARLFLEGGLGSH